MLFIPACTSLSLWHNICCWKDAFVGRNDEWIFMQAKAEINHERESLHVPTLPVLQAGVNHVTQTFQSEASPTLFRDGVRLRNWALDLLMICKQLGSWDLSQSRWEYICLLAYMIHICPYPSSLLKLSTFDMKLKFRQFLQIKSY